MRKLGLVGCISVFALALILVAPLGVRAQGAVDVTAIVAAEAPVAAPTIITPASNGTLTDKNIKVAGSCTKSLIVKIFSNSIFVGSAVCQQDDTYNLLVDLFADKNELVARQYDMVNQSSPDSPTVTVFYLPESDFPDDDLPPAQPSTPSSDGEQPSPTATTQPTAAPKTADFQLVIDYDYTSQGAFTDKPLRLPIHFVGGTGPYNVSVAWGDGSSNNFVRQNTDKFVAEYVYTRAGLFTVTMTITDSAGQTSRLQFVVLIHGDQGALAESIFGDSAIVPAWRPTIAVAAGGTFVFGMAAGILLPLGARFLKRVALRAGAGLIKLVK